MRRSESPSGVIEQPLPLEGRSLKVVRGFASLLLRQPRRWSWIAPMLWMTLIWVLSGLTFSVGGDDRPQISFLANLVHAFEFGMLAALLLPLAVREDGWVLLDRWTLTAVTILAIGFGVVDEVHQSFVEGRHATAFDVLTDAVGVFCTLKVVFYVSQPESTGKGLAGQLLGAIGLCFVAAAFATVSTL